MISIRGSRELHVDDCEQPRDPYWIVEGDKEAQTRPLLILCLSAGEDECGARVPPEGAVGTIVGIGRFFTEVPEHHTIIDMICPFVFGISYNSRIIIWHSPHLIGAVFGSNQYFTPRICKTDTTVSGGCTFGVGWCGGRLDQDSRFPV